MVNTSVASHKRKKYEDSQSDFYRPSKTKRMEPIPPEAPTYSFFGNMIESGIYKGWVFTVKTAFTNLISPPRPLPSKPKRHIKAKQKKPKSPSLGMRKNPEGGSPLPSPPVQAQAKPIEPLSPLNAYDGLSSFVPDSYPSPPTSSSSSVSLPPYIIPASTTSATQSTSTTTFNDYPSPSTDPSYLDYMQQHNDDEKLAQRLNKVVVKDVMERKPAPPIYISPPPSPPHPSPQQERNATRLFRSASTPSDLLAAPQSFYVPKDTIRESTDDVILLKEGDDSPSRPVGFSTASIRRRELIRVPVERQKQEARHRIADENYKSYSTSKSYEDLNDILRKHSDLQEKTKQERMKQFEEQLKQLEMKNKGTTKDRLPTLTQEQQKRISQILSRKGSESEVVSEGFSVELKREDIWCLNPGDWLNDEVINFYINLLMERNKESARVKTYIFNTHFYSLLYYTARKYDYARVRRWTSKIGEDVFKLDKIIVPIHLGQHWCLAVINFKLKRFEYYDSLLGDNEECLNVMKRWVQDEAKKSNKPIDLSEWTNYTPKDIPVQRNGYDCGVFMLRFAERASRDASYDFSQDSMPAVRKLMVHEIINKKALE